jgi:hypothetical protein
VVVEGEALPGEEVLGSLDLESEVVTWTADLQKTQ